MRKTGCGRVLIVLVAILGLGCAPRGDWISEMLTLASVSGTWEGTIGPWAGEFRGRFQYDWYCNREGRK